MAERVRNSEWQQDQLLQDDLKKYVLANFTRKEVLDFVARDYPQYAWSLSSLKRRLSYFGVQYVRYDIDVEEVETAVKEELEGPGRLLGYRAMHRKVREQHQLPIPRNLVYDVMTMVDPEGMERRGNVGIKKRRRGGVGTFTSLGPNHTHSGDGHDKLMGFMNSTFPLAIYGLQDAFSGYILYLKIWSSNSNPKLIGRWYLEHLYQTKKISRYLRLDKGTETGDIATIHAYVIQSLESTNDNEAVESVQYGPSTSNKIERWWRELHERLEKFFKRQLLMLIEQGHYNPDTEIDRHMLAFIYIPILQKEMDIFRDTIWNNHRVRCQKDAQMPKGVPTHLFSFPECYSAEDCGLHLYASDNLNQHGKSCCLLAIDASCRKACFLNSNSKHVQQKCPPQQEQSLLRCIDRSEASTMCCRPYSKRHRRKCKKACQIVFSSEKEPSKKKIKNVKDKCTNSNRHVFRCVSNITGSAEKPKFLDHPCCRLTDVKKCRDVCRQVMSSRKPGEEKLTLLKKNCPHPFYHIVWPCFFALVSPSRGKKPLQNQVHKTDVRLHCCLRAKTDHCLKLCLETYSEGREMAGGSAELFHRRCGFSPVETSMLTCIADVSAPCRIGCSGLGFCKNFNHRHTELFRSCNEAADTAAERDFENWWRKRRVEIPAMDVIPVKNIKKCLPDTWKAVACVLQIKPCHVKSHGSTICRKDCLKVLGECAEKQKLGVRTVETICESLSPEKQSSCISLENYTKPSLYRNETTGVTHPCYPNPCKPEGVCEINRELPGKNDENYRCTPGCPIDLQSKLLIKNGDFARLPIVQNSKLEGCFKICRCDQKRLSDCPRLPNCVKRKPCNPPGSKESYKHQDKFYLNCNFCVCFDGDVICSKQQCLPGSAYNGTDRLRRNHAGTDSNTELTVTGLPCRCKATYDPVCGSNGKTYRSSCFAGCADLQSNQMSKGDCLSLNPCSTVTCPKNKICLVQRKICIGTKSSCQQYACVPMSKYCNNVTSELLCDTENNQHFNKCSLHASGKEVAYRGLCKSECAPGRGEVCGVDGQTYSSLCALNHAHMLMDYEGPCKTVGKYASEKSTVRCAYIKCPVLKPKNCVGITPPGACCQVCATQLAVLFSEEEVLKTNEIVMHTAQPITQEQVVSRVRRHISVIECDLFGFYNSHGDFILLVKAITENPTKLQFLICNKEAQKIETLIHTASPMFTSDEILSSFRAVSLSTPELSEEKGAGHVNQFYRLMLLLPFLLALSYSCSS